MRAAHGRDANLSARLIERQRKAVFAPQRRTEGQLVQRAGFGKKSKPSTQNNSTNTAAATMTTGRRAYTPIASKTAANAGRGHKHSNILGNVAHEMNPMLMGSNVSPTANTETPAKNAKARSPSPPGTAIRTMPKTTKANGQHYHQATPCKNPETANDAPSEAKRQPTARASTIRAVDGPSSSPALASCGSTEATSAPIAGPCSHRAPSAIAGGTGGRCAALT